VAILVLQVFDYEEQDVSVAKLAEHERIFLTGDGDLVQLALLHLDAALVQGLLLVDGVDLRGWVQLQPFGEGPRFEQPDHLETTHERQRVVLDLHFGRFGRLVFDCVVLERIF